MAIHLCRCFLLGPAPFLVSFAVGFAAKRKSAGDLRVAGVFAFCLVCERICHTWAVWALFTLIFTAY